MKIDAVSAETREPGLRPGPQPVTLEALSYAICRYGAERLQSNWLGGEAAAIRSDTGCEKLRLFSVADRSEDLASFAARGGAFLTGAEAAISIPVGAIAEAEAASIPVSALPPVPESETPPIPPAGCGAASSCEKGKQLLASNFVVLLFSRLRHVFD